MNRSNLYTILATLCAMGVGIGGAAILAEAPRAVGAVVNRTAVDTVIYASSEKEHDISFPRRTYEQVISFFTGDRPEPPPVSARSYLIGDVQTGEIIAEFNSDIVVPIASITKLFTAVTAGRVFRPEAITTVTQSALDTYGSSGGLVRGERFTIDELFDPLLLESSNDTAELIAQTYGRSLFMEEMNDDVRSLSLASTSFDDPSGLSPQNLSSASDLFLFAQYLYKKEPELLARTTNKYVEIDRTAHNSYHYWSNRNAFVTYGDQWYVGGKIGYIPEAAQTMLAFFTVRGGVLDERTYAVIVLQSGSRNRDVATLINYATNDLWRQSSRSAASIVGSKSSDEEAPHTTSLLFVGDIMLDRGVKKMIDTYGKGDHSFSFEKVQFLERADITFGNLEGPASDRGYDLKNLYSFRMSPHALTALQDAGFDVLSVANNHTGDWGRPAFEDTLDRMRRMGVLYVGGGVNKTDAIEPRIYTKNGVSFGYLAFSDVGPQWLAGPDTTSLMLQASDPDHDQIISRAAKQVDVLTVSYHFGNEYENEPSARQRELAMRAIDSGARIVVGHHPHVIQPVERYGDGLIAYSLGNFVFDQNFSEDTMRGLVLEVLFEGTNIVRVTPREVVQNDMFQPSLGE
ncbi:MAG: CapA family protein [bacterium]|nr:CapA family protein [bacterium]